MKKLILLLLLSPLFITAQIISADSTTINFGVVMVGDTDSTLVTLTNNDSSALQVNNIKFYTIYGETPFSTPQTAFTIPANGTQMVWVYFSPIQNILHNSAMVVQHTATSGHEAIPLTGQGRFPMTYYDSTENMEEEALKVALKTRLALGYSQKSYNQARDAMFMTIDNERVNGQGATVNTLECVYTGFNKTSYTSRSNAQTTNPNFNTEHTFPQGQFNSVLPERSDIHHLFPTTNNSNSQRGSKPFGVVTNGTAVTLGGGSFYNNSTFEPRNEQKGRTARALLYFVIRYQDYGNHFSPQQTIIRQWHNTYPVDSIDTQRNDDIFTVQNNRNPFVDYPQLEKRITNFVANSVAPSQFGLDILQTAVDFGNFTNQTPDTFDYVMVNRGNQDITFTNFLLSDPTIVSFGSSSNTNRTIAPGGILTIQVIAQTQNSGSISENLTFSTNIPGSQSSFTIPIRGNAVVVGLEENNLENQVTVYPNPVKNQVYIRFEGQHQVDIRILDLLGKEIDLQFLKNGKSNKIISTSDLANGIYFLELTEGNKKVVKKLVK